MFALLLGVASAVQAKAPTDHSAYEVVAEATVSIQDILTQAPSYAADDPERYYAALHQVLDPVIDYRGFARGVMGAYASSERYRSLDKTGRAQLRKQLNRFTTVIKGSLVETYGKGLLAFAGSKIETLPVKAEDHSKRVVSIAQKVYAAGGAPKTVNYLMAQNKKGQWQLRNVVIEAVNLGKVYRNQFESAARRENGDLDAVIGQWEGEAPEVVTEAATQ
ncbi:MAG: toluene tolerance protein [Gammaproteobacteria bacterium]|nr:MAG: toluene tolerance protein [Gammaproteobacteria bacterium]PIE39265.1 MAG: toluene tolerance protein [Gammaproteobacteria bacterium]